jgi:hypothetical protein
MFASKSIVEHLARGVIGLGAFAAAIAVAQPYPWLALLLLPLGFVALRGCPTCWTVGLIQTVLARARGQDAQFCVDGSCALPGAKEAPREHHPTRYSA